jgi:CubicO group peptidase (beta-lactamase class C family)
MHRILKHILLFSLVLAISEDLFAQDPDPIKKIRPILEQHCFPCHHDTKRSAGISLKNIFMGINDTKALIVRDGKVWMNVVKQIQSGEMPPRGQPQMSVEETETLVRTINEILYSSLSATNPGRVVIRRLSHGEYQNSVYHLTGVLYDAPSKFPADGSGGAGFDNFASTLFFTPLKMERYYEAAEDIMDRAHSDEMLWRRIVPVSYKKSFWKRVGDWFRNIFTTVDYSEGAVKEATDVIVPFASRAYRRLLEQEEKDKLISLFRKVYEGSTDDNRYDLAVKETLKAILVSPNFLYRYEEELPLPLDHSYALSDFELATRLSYFLWSTLPDKELFDAAYRGDLQDSVALTRQVQRMLRDPKAKNFAESFVTQWFGVNNFRDINPLDPERFPEMTPSLREAMYMEMVEYFYHILTESKNLLELLDSDYTFVNEELARHYGLADVHGSEMRKVQFKDGVRGGVLTMGSVLATTSMPLRTSPVLRGKWVLEEILGAPPPPPPPDAGELPEEASTNPNASIRDLLTKHRAHPACSGCHQKMDPIGFGLENFDPTGRWRNSYGSKPVIAWDTLPSGEIFRGPMELKKILASKQDEFARTLSEKMFIYAIGRNVGFVDELFLQKLVKNLKDNHFNPEDFIIELVHLEPFRFKVNDKGERLKASSPL